MSGTIQKNDIISDDALKVFSEIVTEFKRLVESANSLKASLKDAGFNETGNGAKKAGENTKALIKNTQEFQSIISLGKQKYKEDAAAFKKAEQEKSKELNRRAALSKQQSGEYIREKKAEEAADKRTATERQRLTQLIIIARQTEVGSLSRLNALNNIYSQKMKGLNVLIPEQAKQYAALNKAMLGNQQRMTQMAMGAQIGGQKFNMLGWQIMQVTREMPAFAYGINVGIGALSNNLPMLFAEINNVRKANAALMEQGKPVTSVFKQIASSVFSWQTALVAGVTLITLYGKEIGDWIAKVFESKKAIDVAALAEKNLAEARKSASEAMVNETTKMEILYRATQDNSRSMEERTAAVDELQKMYPKYLGNLSDEEIIAGKASVAYDNLKNSIIEKAKAQAYSDKIAENSIAILELENKLTEATNKQSIAQDNLNKQIRKGEIVQDGNAWQIKKANIEVVNYRDEIGNLVGEIEALAKSSKELEKNIVISDWNKNFGKDSKTDKSTGKELGEDDSSKDDSSKDELILNSMLDTYKAHYIKRLSEARNNAKETILIEAEKIRNLLYEDAKYNNLSISQREELFAETKNLEDKYLQIQKEREIDTIIDASNKAKIIRSQEANEEFQNSSKRQRDKIGIMGRAAISLMEIEYKKSQDIQALYGEETDEYKRQSDIQAELQEALAMKGIDLSKELKDQKIKDFQEAMQQMNDLAQEGFNFGSALNERAVANNERRFELETAAAGENEFKKLSAEKKYEKEAAKLKRKQAIADKAAAATNVIINTAVAISSATTNGPLGLFLIPLLAAIGALQLATVLAQPIPTFADGTDNFGGGLALVGDKKGNPNKSGGSELIIYPDGKRALSPSTPTLMDLPRGTSIIPHDETTRILAQKAIERSGEVIDMSSTNKHLRSIEKNTGESISYSDGYKIIRKNGFIGKYKV